jgi:hypothetical protein
MRNQHGMWRRATQYALAFTLTLLGQAASAQELSINPMSSGADGTVVPTLVSVVENEMDNLAAALSGRPDYRASELKALKAKLPAKTVVHGDYTWIDDQGVPQRKVYYGLSGKELDDLITNDISTDRPSAVRTRATFTDFNSRLADIPDVDARGNPVSRELDAELKVARTLERDIGMKRVGAGGKLELRVSQAPCPSCTKVLNDLVQLNPNAPLTVKVHYLPANPEKLVDAPSARFHRGRMEVLKRDVSPGRKLAAEAISSGRSHIAGCL